MNPGDGQVTIAWDPPDGPEQPVTVDPAEETATVTGLSNDTEYTFIVRTVDTSENVSDGKSRSATPRPQLIAFISSRDGNYEIYVMDADGSDQTRITNDSANDAGPHWSPK